MEREGHIMSQCESCEVELSALMDGESSPARMVTLLDHLTGCPSCRQFYGELRRFQQVVDDLTAVEADAEHVIPLEAGDRTARPHAARLPRWAWGMAAALIVAVGLYATMDRFGGLNPSAPDGDDVARTALPLAERTLLTIQLEENKGQMDDVRFMELATELLRSDRRYHAMMHDLLEVTQRDRSSSESRLRLASTPSEAEVDEPGGEIYPVAASARILF
jgi:hypothetical protein